ncbi:sigma 54-interacting transcriptional regulator [Virgibacillus sp. W0181]|uniref:sigma 54-interacting transcriptional regulator n=1 Tax=Virgibacillus sp. W0181 TaxID=3391581 RepID=UPI003F45E328
MIKIQLVVPRKDYISASWKTFLKSYEKENDLQEDFEVEELVIPVEKLHEHQYEADVIISRGLLSKKLKGFKLQIPIVDIPVQGIDLVRSLFVCRRDFGKKKVAVIGASNMIYGVDNLQEIVDLEIEQYYLNNLSDIPYLVDKAKDEGCEFVLAGVNTCEYAKEQGLQAEVIQTSVDSFHQALREAESLAVVSRTEQKKTQRFQTILDNAYEGIIAIDLMQRITALNNAAQRILLIEHPKLIGEKIDNIITKSGLLDLITSDQDYKEDIITYRSVQLSVKKVAIYLRNNKVGDMIAFQDVTGIEEMEKKIRKKIYLRGHVAKHTFEKIISQSEVVQHTIEVAKKYSKVDSNILVIGETGTGKEVYTQSIHNFSKRRNHPFVAVNCAALPENLLESELFGYVEGAFTGAAKGGKKGFFELAHRGTIFLDEIGEISVNLQSRLLRVIQEREVVRIGDDKVIPIDVRIIAATNKNLLELVKNNAFREDLYYRLSVLNLHLPPLRACKKDIPLMVKSFIKKYTLTNQPIHVTEAALERLSKEKWEGNVRELQNFCERLAVLCKDNVIDITDINAYLPKQDAFIYEEKMEPRTDLKMIPKFEREQLIEVLKENHFRREDAAKQLGVSRTTLWRKIKKHKLDI